MHVRFWSVRLPLVALALAPLSPARADVTLQQQLRQVDVRAEVWGNPPEGGEAQLALEEDSESSVAAGPFNAALEVRADAFPNSGLDTYGIATQTSTIAPGRFQASGRIEVYSDSDHTRSAGMGRSTFDVTFQATQPQQFTLDYDFVEGFSSVGEAYEGVLRLTRLDVPGGPVTVFEEPNGFPRTTNDPRPSVVRGVLEPGTYRFLLRTGQQTDVGHEHLYEFTLDFATVPEPGAVSVIAGGFGILLRRSRRGAPPGGR